MAVNGCSDFAIHGAIHNVVHGNQLFNSCTTCTSKDPMDKVFKHAALDAIYNSEQRFPPPNCLPGTRIDILADCNRWIEGRRSRKRVLWVHGPAGVGKSAIMQNLSENHLCKGKLLVGMQSPWQACNQTKENACHRFAASFFFSRNDPSRDNLDRLVATIIYQFLTSEPLREVLGPLIIEAIRSNPGIFQFSFEDQFRKLILEPCSKVDSTKWKNLPNLIVVDGLDECVSIPSQERLITMIREAILESPLIFLLSSRPEPRICRALNHESFAPILGRLAVGESTQSTLDIAAFFHHRFSQLQDTHHALHHLDKSWPGEDVIWKLVDRACGQFIFAVTVMKYLESDDELPTERLRDILCVRTDSILESPYRELDLLYHQILATCPHWNEMKMVLRLILTMPNIALKGYFLPNTSAYLPPSLELIAAILRINTAKIQSLLFRLHAVLEVPKDATEMIRIPHASFTEFLLDPTRSGDYHTEPYTEPLYHDLVAQELFRVFRVFEQEHRRYILNSTAFPRDIWHSPFTDSTILSVFHLILSLKSPSAELLAALDRFDPYSFVNVLLVKFGALGWMPVCICSSFDTWKAAAQWTKCPDAQVPRLFLEKTESFLSCFRIGGPRTSTLQLYFGMAFLEQILYRAHCHVHDWHSLLGGSEDIRAGGSVYIIAANQTPPPSWLVVTITREKGEQMAGLLNSLVNCLEMALIKDIREDTYESVRDLDLSKQNVYALKKLVEQRRKEFGLELYPCTPPGTKQLDQKRESSTGLGSSPSRKRARHDSVPQHDKDYSLAHLKTTTRGSRCNQRIASNLRRVALGTSSFTALGKDDPFRREEDEDN